MLRCGDCLDPAMYPKKKADLILFDPPFWPFKQQYKQVRKENQREFEPILTPTPAQYPLWWEQLCEIASQHLKKSGWFCYKSDSWTAKLTFPITQQYFQYSNEVIWDKCRIGLGRRIRTQHEQVECYMAKGSKRKYWKHGGVRSMKRQQVNLDGEVGEYKIKKWHGSSQGIAFPSVIRLENFNSGTLKSKAKQKKGPQEHINQTPFELWLNFIDYMSPPDGLVLDLTAGLGSIGLAVKTLNKRGAARSYWAIEIEPKYVKKARKILSPSTILTQMVKNEVEI